MKIGLSSYSLFATLKSGEMTILDVMEWIAEQGGEHVELVPNLGFTLEDQTQIEKVRNKAKELGLDISNYAIGANFLQPNKESYQAEMNRVKKRGRYCTSTRC